MHHRKTSMSTNFQQSRVSRSIKPYTQIYLQIIASRINLQLPIVILWKAIILDMHHRITYMYINFQQNRTSRSVKNRAYEIYLQKIASCINLQLPIVILKKSIMVSRSVKTVHTYLFANNCKSHKFATTNSNFVKSDYFRHASSHNVHVYQFPSNPGK